MKSHPIHHRLRCLTLGAAVALTSCASVERAPQTAGPDRPAPGNGMVTFYRERRIVGMAVGFNVREDGQRIGGLPNGTYFVHQAAPGTHRYTAATESTDEVTIPVQAGQSYYVRGTIGMGVVVGRPHLAVVTPGEAAEKLPKLRRVTLRAEAE